MSIREIVLATKNQGKASEFERLFGGSIHVRALPSDMELPPETGLTFRENALIKARAAFDSLGGSSAVLADDSGLEVDALGGRPGVFSARYAGPMAADSDNVAKLLAELENVSNRAARFVCELVLIIPGGQNSDPITLFARGEVEGQIVLAPRGTAGFGYDPVFQPEGWEKTLAEAAPEEKDAVSHRGRAAKQLLQKLTKANLVS